MTTFGDNDSHEPGLPPSRPSGRNPFWFIPPLNLQSKLIVPYVILTVLTAAVGAFVVTQLVVESFSERFANQLNEAARVAADGVVRTERDHLEHLRVMANTVGVPAAVAQRDDALLLNLLSPLAYNKQAEILVALDRDGQMIFTLWRRADGSYQTETQPQDFSQYPLVADILQGRQDDLGDKFVGVLKTADNTDYLMTSAPVRDQTTVVGVLLMGTRLDHLLIRLKSEALADIVVLDNAGQLLTTTLATPDEGFAQIELTSPTGPDLQSPLVREALLFEREFQILYAPLMVRRQPLGILGVILPSNYIYVTAASNRDQISIVFALGTGGVIVMGYFLSRSITRPILRLRTMSQAVAAGDLNQQLGLRRADEIGDLASTFDVMTVRLRERTAEAARLYAEMVQRNKELAETNQRLHDAKQQLIQSEKLAAIGQLTAGIVHDVKNPLAVIKGLADIMLEDTQHDEEARLSLVTISDSATKASQIVSDLLKFARQSKLERTQRDLRETVEASLRLTEYLARRARVKVTSDLPKQSVLVAYDAQQIEQVLINLIHNAIQAMPNGGALRVNLSQAKEAVALAIQDTGSGIAPENLSRIFDPFFTTKPEGEGTGLGLSVGYGIIASHGGRIDVESTIGQGTTFIISLPTTAPEMLDMPAPDSGRAGPLPEAD